MKKGLRDKLKDLKVQRLPEPDASAEAIRIFLQKCGALGKVTKLQCKNQKLVVIPPELKLLTGLTHLDLSQNNIELIENLDGCKALIQLQLNNNKIKRIQNLDSCRLLNALDLSNNLIKKIENLGNCQKLKGLNLGNNLIEKIENLNKSTALEVLNFDNNKIKAIENLGDCRRLTALSLNNNQIPAIQNLDNFPGLKGLGISNNLIEKIENLDKCMELKRLDLSKNKIRAIKGLGHCLKLTGLDLSNNLIKVIENLGKHSDLDVLNLSQNQIEIVENLDECSNLTTLYLNNNWIKVIEKLDNTNLKQLGLVGNILMVIPHPIVQKFQTNPAIQLFEKQKSYICNCFLAKLYQGIMKQIPQNKIEKIFTLIKETDKNIFPENINNEYRLKKLNYSSNLFRISVQEAILKKFNSLSQEKHAEVCRKVYELTFGSMLNDLPADWGKAHAKENIPLLADALEMCGV